MSAPKVSRIARFTLVVSDLAAAARFYCEALGFSEAEGTSDEAGRRRRLRLGDQLLEIVDLSLPGARYPTPRAANDPWFQHFAIAVSDMAAAYERLRAYPHAPISEGGPQRLPPSTGSVTAYKFRDMDGHPLELSYIPGSRWTQGGGGPFVGIDHSGLAVADLAASIAFYEALGLRVTGRGLNQGPEQDRLDGLSGVVLDIVSMATPEAGPHIELLHYRRPASPGAGKAPAANDLAATRLVMLGTGEDRQLRDPDGHIVQLSQD